MQKDLNTDKASFIFSVFNKEDRLIRDTVYIKADNYEEAVHTLRNGGFLKDENSVDELGFTAEIPLF